MAALPFTSGMRRPFRQTLIVSGLAFLLSALALMSRSDTTVGTASKAGPETDLSDQAARLERQFDVDHTPLFKLSDPAVKKLFDKETQKALHQTPNASWRVDWKMITDGVKQHIAHYGPGTLIVAELNPWRAYGALPGLEESDGVRYIPVPKLTLGLEEIHRSDNQDKPETLLADTMLTAITSVQQYNSDLQNFLSRRRQKRPAYNLFVGLEETGFENSNKTNVAATYGVLMDYVADKRSRPFSILYINEFSARELADWRKKYAFGAVEKARADADRFALDYATPVDRFLIVANQHKIPIEFLSIQHAEPTVDKMEAPY